MFRNNLLDFLASLLLIISKQNTNGVPFQIKLLSKF